MKTMNMIATELADYFSSHLSVEAKTMLEGRAEKMMYNAAMLIMNGKESAIESKNILRCYTDLAFAKENLGAIKDRDVYDYWTNEVPNLMKEQDARQIIKTFNDEYKKIATSVVIAPEAPLPQLVNLLISKKYSPEKPLAK